MGLGYGRQCPGPWLPEEVRLGHGAQRAHSPDDAKSRRQHYVPHRCVHGISATETGSRTRARTDEGTRRPVARPAGSNRCEACSGAARAGRSRFELELNLAVAVAAKETSV